MTRKVFQSDFGSQADQMVLSAATNPIHNGGFDVWQRGTSFAAVADSSYTADRWVYYNNSAAVHTILRSTDVPAVAALTPLTNYSMHLDVTTSDAAIAAGDQCLLTHIIEGYTWAPFAQQPLTIGFWVKDTITGSHAVALLSGGASHSCVMEYTVNVADTWEYKTLTFPASPSAGGWGYTTSAGVYLIFVLAAGSTYQTTAGSWQAGTHYDTASTVNSISSTSNNFKLWGVTMGLGTTVAPFWPRSFGQELSLCQRYCYLETPAGAASPFTAVGYAISTTVANAFIDFPVTMRTAPSSVTTSGSAADYSVSDGVTATVLSVVPALGAATPQGARLTLTVASGLTQFRPYNLRDATGSGKLLFSADL